MDILKGKKTYLIAIAGAVIVFANAMGWINDEVTKTLLGLLGAGGLATLRAGVSKTSNGGTP